MKKKVANKRPKLVTVVSIILFILIGLSLGGLLIMFFSPATVSEIFLIPSWYPFYSLAVTLLELVTVFYIFNMKRWALIFATGLLIVETVVSLGVVGFSESIISIIIFELILLGLLYTKYNLMK